MNECCLLQTVLTLTRLLRQNVSLVLLAAFDLAARSDFEALCSSLLRFDLNLRHRKPASTYTSV